MDPGAVTISMSQDPRKLVLPGHIPQIWGRVGLEWSFLFVSGSEGRIPLCSQRTRPERKASPLPRKPAGFSPPESVSPAVGRRVAECVVLWVAAAEINGARRSLGTSKTCHVRV